MLQRGRSASGFTVALATCLAAWATARDRAVATNDRMHLPADWHWSPSPSQRRGRRTPTTRCRDYVHLCSTYAHIRYHASVRGKL